MLVRNNQIKLFDDVFVRLLLMKYNATVDVQSENNISFPVFDRCIIYIWSQIGADPVLSLDVCVTCSSYAVALVAASLWNDVFLPPYSFGDFQFFFCARRELFFNLLFTCAYLILQLLSILHIAVYRCEIFLQMLVILHIAVYGHKLWTSAVHSDLLVVQLD
jgi:hypothetical protein